MGQATRMQIEEWQRKAGIEPVTGERLEAWRHLQGMCFYAIRIAELEVSGIRGGDGNWHGDAIGHLYTDLREAIDRLERKTREHDARCGRYDLSDPIPW